MKKTSLLLMVFLLFASPVLACGMLLSADETNVRSEHMTASILWDEQNQKETLALQIQYAVNQGNVDDFGWVMPFPSPPAIEETPKQWFSHIFDATIDKQTLLEQSTFPSFRSDKKEGSAGSLPADGFRGVTVIDEKSMGVYQTATVQAKEVHALTAWAKEHGYHIPWKDHEIFQYYIDQNWFFVLLSLHHDKEKQTGDIHPLTFTFDTPEVVYPFWLTSLNREGKVNEPKTIPLTLYAIAKQKLSPKAPIKMPNLYAGAIPDGEKQRLGLSSETWFVTKWSETFTADQIQGDLYLQPEPNLADKGTGKMTAKETILFSLKMLFGGISFLFAVLFSNPFLSIVPGILLFIWLVCIIKWKSKGFWILLFFYHGIGAMMLANYYRVIQDTPLPEIQLAMTGLMFIILAGLIWKYNKHQFAR
jgi:hypothetical protein